MSPPTTVSAASPPPPSDYDVEFRDIGDEAWYTVRTLLDGDKLTVKYLNFGDEEDNVFDPGYFTSLEHLEEFEDRFRPVSLQLQDRECRKAAPGTAVCVSHSFDGFDVRFYDAIVDDVIFRDHSSVGDKEEACKCTFVIVWGHGPNYGCIANKKVEDICIVHPNPQLDSKVALFIEIVRDKFETVGQSIRRVSTNDVRAASDDTTSHQAIKHLKGETKYGPLSLAKMSLSEENFDNHNQRIREDIDIGGHSKFNVVLIDNLDKELSPSTIMDFIHRQISVTVQAYIFPSLPWEAYTKAAIALKCPKNFEKLCELLDGPNRIVVSKRGRPLVVNGKLFMHDMNASPIITMMPIYQDKSLYTSAEFCNDLKVVHHSTDEYEAAKQMKDIFMDFIEHQEGLHKNLIMDEREIPLPSKVV